MFHTIWVLSVVVIHRHHDALPRDVARHWQEKLARFLFFNVEYPDLCGTTRISECKDTKK